jgi:hypothetical protein
VSAEVVAELVAVMGQTRSKDVYTAAVLALGQMGAEARPALPAILKHAERLGVLEGAFCPAGSKSDQGDVILEAVMAIARGQAAPAGSYPPAPRSPVAPACYSAYGRGPAATGVLPAPTLP